MIPQKFVVDKVEFALQLSLVLLICNFEIIRYYPIALMIYQQVLYTIERLPELDRILMLVKRRDLRLEIVVLFVPVDTDKFLNIKDR